MAAWNEIQIICKDCAGTGKKTFPVTGGPVNDEKCQDCKGVGYIPWGRVKRDKE